MNNKFLFTGEESYWLTQELAKWKTWFSEKHGEQWIFSYKWDNIDLSSIKNTLLWWGMFSAKKLVIIHWVPKENDTAYKIPTATQNSVEDRIIKNWETVDPEAIIVLVCHKPDKRTKWWKFFEKHSEVRKFDPLKPQQCKKKVASTLWSLINAEQSGMIVDLVWTNVRNLIHECEKLQFYAAYNNLQTVTNEQIASVVYHQWDTNAFALLDTLFTDKTQSLTILEKLQTAQQDIFQTTWMLYRWLKIVIQIIDCLKKWMSSGKDIAKTIKAPPFAVAKQMKMATTYRNNEQAITQFFETVVALDYQIKTWRLPAEWFRVSLKKAIYQMDIASQ